MPWLIGADEAGYGPNYGPLVVGVSVWRIPSVDFVENLYERLADGVARDPAGAARDGAPRAVIGDSKQLYTPWGGLGPLEQGVLAAWLASAAGGGSRDLPRTWRDIWTTLDPASREEVETTPWHRDHRQEIPIDGELARVTAAAERLRRACDAVGVRLVALHARGVFPGEFNREVERRGNKAELLSLTTLELVREALERHASDAGTEEVRILCDKHGGRSQYAALLQHCFGWQSLETRRETRAASGYRWRHEGRATEIEFRMGGEAALPVALASMTAKYLRELAMDAFNAFWRTQVSGLAPTAGYPTDAKRFRAAIAARQCELRIAEDDLWRRK